MINFQIPSEFMSKIILGEFERYGTIIKDKSTGHIVGHLKEVGGLSEILSNTPNPTNFISSVVENYQLKNISKTLESLQMVNNIGAMASVATLGVSVAGFAVVINKLNKIDEKLDVVLEKIDRVIEIVEGLQMKNEILDFAEVKTASEQLQNALHTKDIQRRKDLLTQANVTFHKYRNYYLKMAQNLWEDGKLPFNAAQELYSRFITCAMGQLYTEFLLGDLSSFEESWKVISKEVSAVSKMDTIQAFRAKSNSNCNNLFETDYDDLFKQVQNTKAILVETDRRINTMQVEVQYLKDNNIEPFEYLKELGEMDTGIILIPVSASI